MKILIIVNPHSRKNKKTNCASVNKFKKIGGDYVEVKATKSIRELDKVISDAKRKKIPFIGISGGDGTIHNVLSEILRIYGRSKIPSILLLGDGTMNNIATSIGMAGNSEKLLKNFIGKLNKNEKIIIKPRDTMNINGQFGFLFGFGLVTNFLNAVYKDGKKSKSQTLKVIFQSISEIIKSSRIFKSKNLKLLKPVNINISVDKEKMPFNDILGLLAGTVEFIGMGFKTLYKSNQYRGKFHLILTAVEPIKLLKNMHKLKYGKPILHEKHIDRTVSEIKIDFKNELEYTIDGDMYKANKKIIVKVGPVIDFITLK